MLHRVFEPHTVPTRADEVFGKGTVRSVIPDQVMAYLEGIPGQSARK